MRIKIYQINMERDENRITFIGLDKLPKFQSSIEVDSSIYDCVYVGQVDCKDLEDVFHKFNVDHPVDYKARSLSVSDVVEVIESDTIKPGFYFCDIIGFKEIPFDQSKTQISDRFCDTEKVKIISVLLIQPDKHPKTIEIEDSLEAMRRIVGGPIEAYMPFEDEVAIVCNGEGKNMGQPLNRAIFSDEKEMIEIIAGNFFIAYAPALSEEFLSLPDDLAKKYSEKFYHPEVFVDTAEGAEAVPLPPEHSHAKTEED